MRSDLPILPGLVIPADELHETASRASGPGGQHVNKTSTRVTLRWNLLESAAISDTQRRRIARRLASRLTRRGHLVVHAGQRRSRARNRELARERLAQLVREALQVQRPRIATREGRASRERGLEAKRRRGLQKRGRGRLRGDDG